MTFYSWLTGQLLAMADGYGSIARQLVLNR